MKVRDLRVAYISVNAGSTGGWGRYTVELVRAARSAGIEPVLVLADPEIDPRLAGIECQPVLRAPFSGRFNGVRNLSSAPRLRAILATCHLVHCLVESYAPLVALSLPRGVPFVLTAHGSWAVRPLRSVPGRWFFAPAVRRVDLLVCQSRYTRDQIGRLIRLPPHVVEPAGVDPAEFESAAPVALPPWAKAGPIVLSVGALKPRKGHHIAIQAVGQVMQRYPDLQHVLIGAGRTTAYGLALQEQVEAMGVAERVHFLESVPAGELVAWYQRADVFLLLPVNLEGGFEGLGLCYLEAAAAGRPGIGTLGCGAAEAVADGETGLLVPQADVTAGAEALLRLLGSEDLRLRLGRAGRRRARQFTWGRLAGRLKAEYERLAAGDR